MSNSATFEVLVISQNGWWSVICKSLEISGFGETEEAARLAFERSFTSTMLAKFRASFSQAMAENPGADLPCMQKTRAGDIVHRATISLGKAAV